MNISLFDMIAGGILLVSGFVGYVRGAAREVITVLALLVATVVALFLLRYTGPIARHALHPDWIGNFVALLTVFVLAYIVLRVGASAIGRRMQNTKALGILDRTVGFGFGLVRGLVVLGVFSIVFSLATPPDRMPDWITHSMLYPLSFRTANVLRAVAPQGSRLAGRAVPVLEHAVRDGTPLESGTPSAGHSGDRASGQTPAQRRSMDSVVEQSRGAAGGQSEAQRRSMDSVVEGSR